MKVSSDNITNIDWPALNWLVHVLAEDVGSVKWVRMTKEEQAKHDKECPHNAGYPYKVVEYPILKGKKIILKSDGKYVIKCDSEQTRNLLIQMAIQYKNFESETYYWRHENGASEWHKIEELPPHSKGSAFRESSRRFLVWSPTLSYVGGSVFGFRDGNKWYLDINGKEIEHQVTHYRIIPPSPNLPTANYEDVKEEVEKIKKILGYNNE